MRSDAYITVTCDKCGCEEQIQLTALARNAYDERNVDGELRRMGWTIDDGIDLCEDCARERAEENEDEPA